MHEHACVCLMWKKGKTKRKKSIFIYDNKEMPKLICFLPARYVCCLFGHLSVYSLALSCFVYMCVFV